MVMETGSPPPVINGDYEMVPVADLEAHPLNVNEGDLGAIHESLASSGFFGAVVAQRSTKRILVGKHRWMTAAQAGMSELPVIWVDVDDDRAVRIMLADNRTARLGHDDDAALAELLSGLMTTDLLLEGTGYDGDDLDELLKDKTHDYVSVPVVIVECHDEQQQSTVLDGLKEQGLSAYGDVKKRTAGA